jgi:hypothetical protein
MRESSAVVELSNFRRHHLQLPARRPFLSQLSQSGFHTDSIFGQVRNTTVQVWAVGERVGIGSEFSQTCCAANNFRDHDVTSPLNSLPLPDPTHAGWIGSDIFPI